MALKKIPVQLFLLFLLFGCVTNKKINQKEVLNQGKSYEQIAVKKFGEKVEYKLNSDKTYALCEKMILEPLQNPNQLIEFFVFDIQKEEIVYSDKIANIKISWYNNAQLLITRQKGYIADPTDSGKSTYVFDLKSMKKVIAEKVE